MPVYVSGGGHVHLPPPASAARLGSIAGKLGRSRPVKAHFKHGGDFIAVLPGGQLYFEGPLELDTDGSKYHSEDPTGQSETTLHDSRDRPLDANRVPYFVLPRRGFYEQFGIRLGDIAAVIYRDRVEYAVFGDEGPVNKLGEGSIALHRALGHETIRDGRLHNEGIDSCVITIVFPGSGKPDDPQTPERIRRIGRVLFTALGGSHR